MAASHLRGYAGVSTRCHNSHAYIRWCNTHAYVRWCNIREIFVAVTFMHTFDVVGSLHMRDVVILIHILDAVIFMYIRVTAALRLIRSLNIENLSPEEVLGRSLGPLGLSVDPLGEVRRPHELLCKCVFQLLAEFGCINQHSEYVDKYACSTFR